MLFAEGEVEKWAHLPHLDYDGAIKEGENDDNKQPLNKIVTVK